MRPSDGDDASGPQESVSLNVSLGGKDFSLSFVATVPKGPTHANELYPLARAISDAVVGETCRTLEEAGTSISCAKGCGACCRNLVAVSELEARRIAALVEAMPEPRRSTVQARFESALEQLAEAGLLDALRNTRAMTHVEYNAIVGSYFEAQVACPFLEDESCSIHLDRPITCREYLVTSAPEHCSVPGSEGVEHVQLPLRTFNAVARWQASGTADVLESWVPLTLAPEWSANHQESPPPKPGPELLKDLLDAMGQQGS